MNPEKAQFRSVGGKHRLFLVHPEIASFTNPQPQVPTSEAPRRGNHRFFYNNKPIT